MFIDRGMILKVSMHSYNGLLYSMDIEGCLKFIQWGKRQAKEKNV